MTRLLSCGTVEDVDAFPPKFMRREEWRQVPGWPYEVSDEGRVRRVDTGRILKAWHAPQVPQYPKNHIGVTLCRNGERWSANVHDLVRQAFCVDPQDRRLRELLDNVSNVGV